MAQTSRESPAFLSVGEIAQLAGVRSSAVSNWRTRHVDFPVEVSKGKFDRQAVIDWLRRHGKKVREAEDPALERLLWTAVDELRGHVEVSELPALLLQLLTLRSAGARSIERLEPLSGWWERVRDSLDETLHGLLAQASGRVADDDPDLARALRPGQGLQGLSRATLEGVLHRLDSLSLEDAGFGRAATGILEVFATKYGFRGAENLTSSSLTRVLVDLMEPIQGVVYDPACGAAMALGKAWGRGATKSLSLYGQEINEQSWRLGFLHLLLKGARFELRTGNTLLDDAFREIRADRILLDPPLGQKITTGQQAFAGDERWTLGLPGQHSGDLLWAQQLLFHLADGGRGVMVTSPGTLFRGGPEAEVRRRLVGTDTLDAVILLPPGMMAWTKIPVALLLFERARARAGRLLFIDGRQLGEPQRGGNRIMADEDFARITDAVRSWRNGSLAEELQFSAVAPMSQVLEADADLSPNKYIRYSRTILEIGGERIPDRLQRLRSEVAADGVSLPERIATVTAALAAVEESVNQADRNRVTLGELLLSPPLGGMRQDEEADGEPLPFIATSVVSGGTPILAEPPREMTFGDPGKRLTQADDLLLVARGVERTESVGCTRVVFDTPTAYSESLVRLRVNSQVALPDYVRLFLSSRQGAAALGAAATGSVISYLKRDALAAVEIQLPPVELQRQVVELMSVVEEVLAESLEFGDRMSALHDALREGFAGNSVKPGRRP